MSIAMIFRGSPLIKPDLCQPWLTPQPFDSCGNKSITSFPEAIHFPTSQFEVKASLKYIGWFSSAAPSTLQCLSAADALCPLAFKKFKLNKAPYKVQVPSVTVFYILYVVCFLYYFTLFLKTLLFSSLFVIFYTSFLFFLQHLSTFLNILCLFRGPTHL